MYPCSESFWLRGALLECIGRSKKRVSRYEIYNEFSIVDESIVMNELRCLEANGKIRSLYDDELVCLFEIA